MQAHIDIFWDIFVFAIGACVGSFANVLIHRLPRRESIIKPPSHCPRCGAKIKFYDNIPIISYIILGGKCRNCGEPISIRYPLVELLLAVSYLLIFEFYKSEPIEMITFFVVVPIFVAITIIDITHWKIPDELSIALFIIGFTVSAVVGEWGEVVEKLIAAIIASSIFWILAVMGKKVFGKDALGEGDIILVGGIGALVGILGVLEVIVISAVIGLVGGTITIILRKTVLGQKTASSAIPYAPFLITAALIVMIWGDKIAKLYMTLYP